MTPPPVSEPEAEARVEIDAARVAALQFFFSVPHRDRLHYRDIKELAKTITAPPRAWTPDKLWNAYELLHKDKVRGASAARKFSAEQSAWLQMIRDHVAASWEIEIDDFDNVSFVQEGGLGKAMQIFGKELPVLLQQINEAVAA